MVFRGQTKKKHPEGLGEGSELSNLHDSNTGDTMLNMDDDTKKWSFVRSQRVIFQSPSDL